MLPTEIAAKKAELINHGKINIPKGFALPYYPSRSTAGPGAGGAGLVFGFSGTRVKLTIVRDGSALFSLARKSAIDEKPDTDNDPIRRCIEGKAYTILKNDEIFLDDVSLEPTLMHAPGQAFINITSKCIYDCSFCVSPDLNKGQKECTVDRWTELILVHANNPSLESVAITSGIPVSPHDTVMDMVKIIKAVHERMPDITIGVEPYLTSKEDIDLLFEAGATELKLNLETPNCEIFEKICPGLDYTAIDQALKYAVTVFGRNKVCSNLIIGLGETDDEVLAAVDRLANAGVVATLRAVRVNDINREKIQRSLGYIPESVPIHRMLELAKKQKEILDNHGLTTVEFNSMCHRCKCCDIVPQQDV